MTSFTSSFWLPSVWNSLIVGSAATLLATVLGTLAALGVWRARFPGQALVLALLISPMVVPVIIVAVGVYFRVRTAWIDRWLCRADPRTYDAGVPFVVVTVLATLSGFDARWCAQRKASAPRRSTTFRRVTLPLILPGVLFRRRFRVRGVVR
jgi:putative spermidine/putrescine transport system permease protein